MKHGEAWTVHCSRISDSRALPQDGSSRADIPAARAPTLLDISAVPGRSGRSGRTQSSRGIQEKVLKGLHLLKKAAKMFSQLDLFSQSEDLEETASPT